MVSSTGTTDHIVAALEGTVGLIPAPLAHATGRDFQTRAGVFEEIFLVFLVLGTIVGVVVIVYSLYNALKYRDDSTEVREEDRPTIGELPGEEGGGRKLFLSFGISAIIVVGLIAWTYGALLYVEAGPEHEIDDNLDVEIVALQFGWEFHYPNGHTEMNTLVIPVDHVINLEVTSRDVWHTFGAPDLRIKADALPGQTKTTWFAAEETGTYDAWCFELCGVGHSDMMATVEVLDEEEFEEWYAETEGNEEDDDDEENDADDEEASENENTVSQIE